MNGKLIFDERRWAGEVVRGKNRRSLHYAPVGMTILSQGQTIHR